MIVVGLVAVFVIGVLLQTSVIVCEQGVKAPVASLRDQAVAVDPGGQAFEGGGVEMDGATLGIARAGDEAGLLEHLDVLGDGLLRDRERAPPAR